jgi:hypothetical protein
MTMNEPDETQHGEETATPMNSSTEKLFVRMTFWQTALSVVGAFIGVVALYAALTESAAVRQQTAAAVWPFVQTTIEDYDTGDTAGFVLSFTNAGVGPAKIRWVQLVVNNEAARNWAHAVELVGGEVGNNVSRNFISNRVLRPDERVDMLSTMDTDLARRFQAAIANDDNFLSYCYCSIFDTCWLADSRQEAHDHEVVESCPDIGDAAFGN